MMGNMGRKTTRWKKVTETGFACLKDMKQVPGVRWEVGSGREGE